MMRTALLGILTCAGLAAASVAASLGGGEALAERPEALVPSQTESGVIAFCSVVDDAYQQLTVIDPRSMAMSVYHVELATGAVELKCVRTIRWDLQMTCYNGKGLLPQEIHSLQEQPR